MAERHSFGGWRGIAPALLLAGAFSGAAAQEAPPASAHLVGTVTALTATQLTLTPDKGDPTTLTLSSKTRVLDLPPGSTDLQAAHPGDLQEVEVGDRVLITSIAGTASNPAAVRRIVVMKSSAIAQKRESDQAGWAHSRGSTVDTVDLATGAITMSSRGKTVTIVTTPTTVFRRYAPDSARFEDTKRSSLAEVHAGDQARVRGEGTPETLRALEIVSGTFEQIGGSVVAIDPAASTMTLLDVRTKKSVVVKVTGKTQIHQLPAQMAAQFAERSQAAGKAGPHQASAATDVSSPRPSSEADLGQAVAHLPDVLLSDLRVGQSILLIATGDPTSPTAMTVLSGAEQLLAAMKNGGAETSLAPWSMSGGDSAGGASQ